MNALSLQLWGILSGCPEKSYVPLNSERCIQRLKNIKILLCHFLLIKIERNPYITAILVYCSVQ